MNIQTIIQSQDWEMIQSGLSDKGYAILPKILNQAQCQQIISLYPKESLFRKTVSMERYRFGKGNYKYFKYPLPDLIQVIRTNIYPFLVPVANLWMERLKQKKFFPKTLLELHQECQMSGQILPTPLLLKYQEGDYNTLHQDLYGAIFFPMQMVIMLNQPEVDFKGGAFVLTQQIPRAQSKAMVLQPSMGDLIIFTTNFLPIKGSRGYYQAKMRHGVSEVSEGERHTLGVIFHDALK